MLLHRIHFSDTACRTGVDHVDTRGAQWFELFDNPIRT
jgi:hypothetical protein